MIGSTKVECTELIVVVVPPKTKLPVSVKSLAVMPLVTASDDKVPTLVMLGCAATVTVPAVEAVVAVVAVVAVSAVVACAALVALVALVAVVAVVAVVALSAVTA
jgi:hypothetical protein